MVAGRWIFMVALVLALSGCGLRESRLNPFNWFGGGSREETVADVDFVTRSDRRPLIDTVTELTVERLPGGILVRATGLPPQQGWHSAELVAENAGTPVEGVLTFAFRAAPPTSPTRVSTPQSREIVVATFVPDVTLANVRRIRVAGARNVRTLVR